MDIFIKVLLILACTFAGLFVFAAAVEIYFTRKEKYFLKQVQISGTMLGQAAEMMSKHVNIQKKEESK